jgi:hypothetical protein
VPRSRRADRFQSLRRHAASRIFAFAFITLILVPFTAPFPSYHLDSAHGRPYDVLPKEFKDKLGSDESLVLPSDCPITLPALVALLIGPAVSSDQIANHRQRHTILRV